MGLSAAQIARARQLWEEGKPIGEIAKDVGIATGTVDYYRRRDGWTVRPRSDPTRRRFAEKLWNEDVPTLDIASVIGVTRSTVLGWRKRYHWKSRPPGHSEPTWEACYRTREGNGVRPKKSAWIEELRRAFRDMREAPAPDIGIWRCQGCHQLRRVAECPTCHQKAPFFK